MRSGLGLPDVWFGVHCGLELAHALAFEFDPVGVVDDAIEDGVGKSWIADDLVPALDRQPTGDHDRAGGRYGMSSIGPRRFWARLEFSSFLTLHIEMPLRCCLIVSGLS